MNFEQNLLKQIFQAKKRRGRLRKRKELLISSEIGNTIIKNQTKKKQWQVLSKRECLKSIPKLTQVAAKMLNLSAIFSMRRKRTPKVNGWYCGHMKYPQSLAKEDLQRSTLERKWVQASNMLSKLSISLP